MKDEDSKALFRVGSLILLAILVLAVIFGGGKVGIPIPFSSEEVRIEVPGQTSRPPMPAVPNSATLVGEWNGNLHFDIAPQGTMCNVSFTFLSSGRYRTNNSCNWSFDPGRWEQDGRFVRWMSSSNTEYIGRIRDDQTIDGITRNPSGYFNLVRVN